MPFNEIKDDLMGAEADMRSYLIHSEEYIRLKLFKVVMQHITGFAKFFAIATGFILALLFLSWALSIMLSETLESSYLGFLIVGGLYVLIGILLLIFREKFNAPILKKFSKYYFKLS